MRLLKPHLLTTGLVLLSGLFRWPLPTTGQEHSVISSDAICRQCRISLQPVATLRGSPPGSAVWMCPVQTRVVVDSAQRYYAIACDRNSVYTFSHDGTLIDTIGRPGQGPGEFQGIREIWVDDDDVLHIFEARRHTAITAEREVLFVRSAPAYARRIIFQEDGSTIQHALIRTPERVGFPLHVIDPSGEAAASFGSLVPEYVNSQEALRAIAPGGNGGVWSIHHVKYELELWNPDNTLRRVIRRDAEWFRELKTERLGYMRDLRRDSGGRLWTLALMPDPEWAGEDRSELPETARVRRLKNEHNLRYDTWLEVIDVEQVEVVVTEHLERVFPRMIGDMTYSIRETDNGESVVDMFRMAIVRPSEGRQSHR